MHPLLRQPLALAVYVAAVLLTGSVLAAVLAVVVPQGAPFAFAFALPAMFVYGAALTAAWWVCRAHPLAPGGTARALAAQAGIALQASGAWAVAGLVWAVALARAWSAPPAREALLADAGALFAAGVPLWLLAALAYYLGLANADSRAAAQRALESRVDAREAELRALRAQLDPHFLFNSLNSISSLVTADPEGARAMCERLGDFLRRTLTLGARADVALAEELELLERYFAIERVRFGARLGVRFDCAEAALACRVPPLLLQPLAENAVKHGVAGRLEGGEVCVGAHLEGGELVLRVENPLDEDAPARPGAHVGLDNVRRRLEAFGAGAARLAAETDGETFTVTLRLPAVAAATEEA